jgi:hypothetical protein
MGTGMGCPTCAIASTPDPAGAFPSTAPTCAAIDFAGKVGRCELRFRHALGGRADRYTLQRSFAVVGAICRHHHWHV